MELNSPVQPRFGYARPALLFLAVLAVGGVSMIPAVEAIDIALAKAMALREGQSPPALIALAKAFTWIGNGNQRAWILGAAFLWLCFERRWRTGLVVLVVPVLGGMASDALKVAFNSSRPDLVPHLVHAGGMSMPSGHAMAGMGISLALAWLLPAQPSRGWVVLAVGVGLCVGLSRVLLGVHWPTDVIAGWLLGVAAALLAREVAGRLER